MFCPKCGVKQQGSDARFCSSCGAPLPAEAEAAESAPVAKDAAATPTAPMPPPPLVTAELPAAPAVPPPAPMPPPPATEPAPPDASLPPAPPRKSNLTCWVCGCLGLFALVVIGLAVTIGYYRLSSRSHKVEEERNHPPTGIERIGGEQAPPSREGAGTGEIVAPEPSEDPVAEAKVVLEDYLAADLGHDGQEMKKYLGGQAAARFRPEVQGQENITVNSKHVIDHDVKDANTIEFKVEVEWTPEDGGSTRTDIESYTVKRTDKGWKITSTPEYPAE